MEATYVGHACVLLELDGTRVLTDPVLRDRVLHLRRSPDARVGDLSRLDAVLVSHAHWDHLDLPSLDRFRRETRMVVPTGAGRIVRKRGFTDVVEVEEGGVAEAGAVEVRAVRADHRPGRGPLQPKSPALGYVIEGSRRVYFAGDTDLFPEMAGFAPLDLALLPVAGWGPRVPAGHLDPRRAADALPLLRPKAAVPIHWGTYAGRSWVVGKTGSHVRDPADEFARLAAETAPDVDVRIIPPGGSAAFD